jgi:hypothetical protein
MLNISKISKGDGNSGSRSKRYKTTTTCRFHSRKYLRKIHME